VILFRNKKLHYFSGNIDTYEQTRARQDLEQTRAHDAQQLKREHIIKFVDKFRASAARAALVQSRIKALNKMDLVDKVEDDAEFQFAFPDPSDSLSSPILQVQDVSFGYPRRQDEGDLGPPKLLFENVNFSVALDSRIAILGPNGAGKTTLMQVVLGGLEPQNGYVLRNSRLRLAHFAQHHVDQVDMNATPLEYLMAKFPGTKSDFVRSHLSQYGITADLAMQVIKTLSGGQKSRVSFAEITWNKPHILVLDEATNHLDLQTVEALIAAVRSYKGGVVFVSHDQHFISQCAQEFWTISDGAVKQFQGSFEEYKKWAVPDK
jgi:ATP-binding cassette subfamily F protein 3